jgi:hypothetical protein
MLPRTQCRTLLGFSWLVGSFVIAERALTAPAGVQGDYNNNGVVDAADYVQWRNGGPLANEVDMPGTVNAANYAAWRARFGNTAGSSSVSTRVAETPEPSTSLLVLMATALLSPMDTRRRRIRE